MERPQIKTIAIIAEGVPERRAREIMHIAQQKGITIIGPATVGGIKPGSFKIGNTGGMMDNIVASKLYRQGSVGYVSKSGGMSNELNNIISTTTNGVYEGVAIGGDRYPGTTFIEHLLRYGFNQFEVPDNLVGSQKKTADIKPIPDARSWSSLVRLEVLKSIVSLRR